MSSIQETNLKAIADAIRAKEKSTAAIQASKFPERIAAIQTGAELSIVVTSLAGSTVTAVKGDITVTGTVGEDGTCTLIVPEPGTWTVTSTNDGYSEEKDVVVDATYPIDIPIVFVPKNWNAIALPTSATAPIKSIAYGNGKIVCFDSTSDSVDVNVPFYSSDGVTWTKSSLPIASSDQYYNNVRVFYLNDRFMAISRSGGSVNIIFYSVDGIAWTRSALPNGIFGYGSGIAYGNGKYVITGNGYDHAYSSNGTSWTCASNLPGNEYQSWPMLAFGNGRFVAVKSASSDGGKTEAAYSEDGVNWTSVTLPIKSYWSKLAFGNGKFVLTNNIDSNSKRYILYSEDGVDWTQAEIPSMTDSSYLNNIVYVNDLFLLTTDNNSLLYSKDGVNWSVSPNTLPGTLYGIIYVNGKYIASMGDNMYTA